jgi:hypothetical protein
MDHDEKTEPWSAQRAWLGDAIDAIHETIYDCTECLDGRRFSHEACERIAQTNAEIRAHIAAGEARPSDLIRGPLEYRSAEAVAQRIADNPALTIPCPECWAHVAQECRIYSDDKYVTCRQRKAITERTTQPTLDLFPNIAPVLPPARLRRAR